MKEKDERIRVCGKVIHFPKSEGLIKTCFKCKDSVIFTDSPDTIDKEDKFLCSDCYNKYFINKKGQTIVIPEETLKRLKERGIDKDEAIAKLIQAMKRGRI